MWKKILAFMALCALSKSVRVDFEELGAIADDDSLETAISNGQLFNDTLNSLSPNDIVYISNKTFTLMGGIKAFGLTNITFLIDGTIRFSNDRDNWPTKEDGSVEECIYLQDIKNVIFTSNGKGTLDGNGLKWWGAIKFLVHQENRPRLLHISASQNVLVENLLFKNSPYWTFWAQYSDGLLIRHSDVDARITEQDRHTLIDLQAFNTDGFDVTGKNVHIHDCNIWNQDDCIAVKDDSAHMLFERNFCSGLGLVIGSIGGNRVDNITFRDSTLRNTVKGIYLKTRWSDKAPPGSEVSLTNILYENITIESPEQWGIWIGPAQQTGQPCSLLWPHTPNAECEMSGFQTWENITLRDIYVSNPKGSPGVLFGNATYPMKNVVFDNVVIENPGEKPWGDDFYFCEGIEGYATGGTNPVPPCFKTIKSI